MCRYPQTTEENLENGESMRLQVFGDAALMLRAGTAGGALDATLSSTLRFLAGGAPATAADIAHRTFDWDVLPSAPLGARHNTDLLGDLLQRDDARDVFFFTVAVTARVVGDAEVPACVEPLDPSRSAIELGLTDGASVFVTLAPLSRLQALGVAAPAAAAAVVPLGGCMHRFDTAGAALVIDAARNGRRVSRPRAAGDSWKRCVAVCATPLDNDGVNSATFRIYTDPAEQTVPGIRGDGTSETPNTRLFGTRLPSVAVGVAEPDIPTDGERQHARHDAKWMMNVTTGALYGAPGAVPGPAGYADAALYQLREVTTITVVVDTVRGGAVFVQDGAHVGHVELSEYQADNVVPCVELYSAGAVVELV
jgi:hypothetical protein